MNDNQEFHVGRNTGRPVPAPLSVLAASILAVALPAPSLADWSLAPLVRVGWENDDNPRLTARTDEEVDLRGYLGELTLGLGYAAERTEFSFRPRLLVRDYPDETDFESNDVFLASTFDHRMRSSSIGFRINYDEQQVRNAERTDVDLDSEDPDDVEGIGTGEVALSGDRSKLRFVPRWTYDFSNTSSIDVRLNYYDVSYDNVFADLLTDYTDARLGLTYRRAMTNRTSFLAMASGRHYEADDPDIENVDGLSGQVGIERAMSETTRLRAMVGVENTEQTVGQKDPEMIGELTLMRSLETISMYAQYRRSVNASGAGQVSVRDQVNVNFNRRLNEKITTGLGVRAYKTASLGDRVSVLDDREYVQLRAQFIWHMTRAFAFETSYQYTVIDRGPSLDGKANSNRINLWFTWEPTPLGR